MVSSKLTNYIDQLGLPVTPVFHAPSETLEEAAAAAGISLSRLVRAVVLSDRDGLVMAVLPADHLLNFTALGRLLGRKLRPAAVDEISAVFADCEPGSIPPLAEPFGIDAVIDETLATTKEVFIEPGVHDHLLKLSGDDFRLAHASARWGHIARPVATLANIDNIDFVLPEGLEQAGIDELSPAADIKRRIEAQQDLPAMPEMAHQLLKLRNDPAATIADLTAIIETDPSLSAQIIRYATSAYFGYRGKIDSIEQAITRVLGFETVTNMALGIAAGKSFQTPKDGPLGLLQFWRHAIYSAVLCQSLTALMPRGQRIKRGMAYLAGLTHNLGFLVLGHLFKPEFYLLNKTVELNPNVPITLIEKRMLGIDHCEIGAALMKAWAMPEELVVSAAEHHNEQYPGEHAAYAQLVLLVDQLLRGYDMGDGAVEDPSQLLLTQLGMELDDVIGVTQKVVEGIDNLNNMARQLAN